MAEGLKGNGDSNEDGYIDVDELFGYVADSVRSWTRRHGDKQTPRKQTNVTGSILIGYQPENLERKRQEAAKETLDAYKRKLRAIIDLDVTELTEAERLLERRMRGEALTEAEEKWAQLIRDLADGQISVEVYRLAIRGLDLQLTGSIFVTSEPPAAQATLDNVLQSGRTPMTIKDVMAGPHSLKLTLNGYQDWEQSINIAAGKATPVDAQLIKVPPSQPEPQSIPSVKKGGNLKWYLLGGAVAIGGGVAAALFSGGSGLGDGGVDGGNGDTPKTSLTVSISVP